MIPARNLSTTLSIVRTNLSGSGFQIVHSRFAKVKPVVRGVVAYMPELSRFFGIVIAMYYRDHPPPHFHAIYGEYEATISIETGAVHGLLPARVLGLVQEWRVLHQNTLLEAWELAAAQKPLPNVPPLE